MTKLRTLQNSQDFPDHVASMIEEGRWDDLVQALDDGLPANLNSFGDVSLFERVLAELEMSRPLPCTSSVAGGDALLEAFLRNGLGRESLGENGMTAVGLSSTYGQWKWVKRLVSDGFAIESPDSSNASALHAMIDGRFQRVIEEPEDVMDSAFYEDDPSFENKNTTPETDTRITDGNVHTLRPKTKAIESPPEGLVQIGRHLPSDSEEEIEHVIETVLLLIASGADMEALDAPDEDGTPGLSPLARAIWTLDNAVTQGLIAAGADMATSQTVDDIQCRPLELAIHRGGTVAVRMLIDAGAPLGKDPALEDSEAKRNQPLVLAARIGYDHIIPRLVEAMPQEDLPWASVMAMHHAAGNNHLHCMKTLHLLGVPFDARTEPNGFSLLHQAAGGGSVETIDFLIEQGHEWDVLSYTGVSAADILMGAHPGLAKQYGLAVNTPVNNVHSFLARKNRRP